MNHDQEYLYFAYGSNLNERDWCAYCARAGVSPDVIEPVGRAVLPDMQLCFDYYSTSRKGGALNIQPMRGHVVHGVLYRASALGWRTLDRKEGAPYCYEQVVRTALRPDGSSLKVITYEATDEVRRDFCAPTQDYRQIVANGLRTWGLPVQALDDAADNRPPRVEIDRLFVYGTLLSGQRNAALIPAPMVKSGYPASTAGTLYDTGNAYPAIGLGSAHARTVRGECLQVVNVRGLLDILDRVEGFAGYMDPAPLFQRTIVDVVARNGDIHRAWCYVAASDALLREPIEHGCWLTHIGAVQQENTD